MQRERIGSRAIQCLHNGFFRIQHDCNQGAGAVMEAIETGIGAVVLSRGVGMVRPGCGIGEGPFARARRSCFLAWRGACKCRGARLARLPRSRTDRMRDAFTAAHTARLRAGCRLRRIDAVAKNAIG